MLEHGGWDAGRPRDRLGALAIAGGLRVRRHAHHHPVVGAVKGALELRDLRPAGEGARQPHRVHRGLGARVREAQALERRHAARDRLGQADLVLGRAGERQPVLGDALDGLHHVTVGVTQHEARVVVVEVETLDTVGIPDVRALAALEVERIRVEERSGPAVTAGHDGHRLLVQRAGAGGLRRVLGDFLVQTHEAVSCSSTRARAASDSLSRRWASGTPTAVKRRRWPGLAWPTRAMSKEHTVAIFV